MASNRTCGLAALATMMCLLWVAALTGCAYAQAPEIRLAIVGGATQPLNVIFNSKFYQDNVLQDYGKKYTVKLSRVSSTPLAGQLLVTDQVDIAMLAGPAISNMLMRGIVKKDDIEIIAAGITDGYPGYVSGFWGAMKDSGIKKPEDLRGKTIALLGFGTASDAALRLILQRHGLDPSKDVRIVELPLQNMVAALEQGRVDVAYFTEPFHVPFKASGKGIALFSHADAFGGPSYNTVAVIKKSTAARLGDALKAYLADFSRGLYWSQNPDNRTRAVTAAAETTNLTAAALEPYYLTILDKHMDPEACVNPEWLQQPLLKAAETGVIAGAVDLRPLINTAYLPSLRHPCK